MQTKLIDQYKNIYGRIVSSERNKILVSNMIFYSIFRVVTAICLFLSVRVLFDFLGQEQYGVWLTISTFTAWFSFFDFGFGNGLRNKLVSLFTENNKKDAKIYVSTVYFLFIIIFSAIYLLIFAASFFIDWERVFNIPHRFLMPTYLILTVNISFLGLCTKLILTTINAVLLADQKTALAEGLNTAQQISILITILILKPLIAHPIITIALINAAVPIIVLLLASIVLFNKQYKDISPSRKHIKLAYLVNIKGLGLRFFIIQIAALVFFSSQNFIIAQFFQPSSVTTYNIVFRYFGILTIISGIILAPFWSMVAKAYNREDLAWIKVSVRRLIFVWVGLIFFAVLMVIISDKIYKIWVNKDIEIPLSFTIGMAVYTMVMIWNGIFANFANGLGKIKIQLLTSIFGMIIYIPLCYFLIVKCHLGLFGVALGSILSLSLGSFLMPIQYNKIMKHKATGIWAA